jgi:hypothetical protein
MSTFTKLVGTTPAAAPDPTRHVNYNVGMLLGVDDFNQEFAYLSGRDQWMARDLIGYGTVSGLRVFTENDVKGPRVVVEPGVAVSPTGQLIRVPTAQCAYLNDWLNLDTTKKDLVEHLASPPTTLRAHVVLCYRECPTAKVPIPGEPCRSEDDVMLPSRLADDYRIELTLDAPGQREEDAVRDFVSWLSQMVVSDLTASTSMADFVDAIRAAAHLLTSPPESGSGPLSDYLYGSPPATLVINSADLCEYLDAAFRIWITELRPRFRPDYLAGTHGCSNMSSGSNENVEECLLLAVIDLPVIVPAGGASWQVEDPDLLAVDESSRPMVVHLRMLQEMLLCGRGIGASSGSGQGGPVTLAGDAAGPAGATRVERIQGVAVASTPPAANQVLRFTLGQWRPAALPAAAAPANTVVSEQAFDQASAPGAAATFSRSDHTHGTPPNPIPAHQADASAHNAHNVIGDVTGTIAATRVAAIQGVPVNPAAPAANQVLTFSGGQWRPAAPPAGGTTVNPATTVVAATTFGLPVAVGGSALYARADHTHGTPPAPPDLLPAHRADAGAHAVVGDVTGTVGATTVVALRNVQLAGTPADGQVLTFRSNRWQPEAPPQASGDAVEHPPGAGRYFIMAAGTVRCDGTTRFPPVYAGLLANATGPNQVTVRFPKYQPPGPATAPTFQYVLKVLPVFNDVLDNLSISFIQFLTSPGIQGGFQLRVTRAGQTLTRDQLLQLELMVEISRYDVA